MNNHQDFDCVALPPRELSRVDEVTARFASALSQGEQPRIEEFLQDVPEVARTALLKQLVSHEIHHRRGCGERVVAEDYERRFPQLLAAATADVESELVGTHTRTSTFRPADERRGRREETPPPQSVGRYEIKRLLGRGAFGSVYLGWDPQLRRDVAIKIPRQHPDDTDEQIDQFIAEAQRAVQLERHSGIVPVYDVGREGDLCYIVAQFIDGGTLIDWVVAEPRSLAQVLNLVARIAEIVQFAHDAGWVHRDIKPSNILIDRDGKPFLTDFGLTARLDDIGESEGTLHGTPNYMAPEVVRSALSRINGGQQDAPRHDHRADIYSLGVVLYELLAGQLPFDADDLHTLFDKALHREPPSLRDKDAAIPARLEQICLNALAKDPADRFQTADQLADQLRAMAGALENRGPLAAKDRSGLSRRQVLTLAAAGLLLIIAAVVAYVLSRPSDSSNPVAPNQRPPDGQLAQLDGLDDSVNNSVEDRRELELLNELHTIVALDFEQERGSRFDRSTENNFRSADVGAALHPPGGMRGGAGNLVPDAPEPALGGSRKKELDQQRRFLYLADELASRASGTDGAGAEAEEIAELAAEMPYEIQTRLLRQAILAAVEAEELGRAATLWWQLRHVAREGDQRTARFLELSESLTSPAGP